jgi:hypothetical protein
MPPYEEVDYGKTVDGKTYLRDTPRTWAYLTKETDDGIALELKGKPPMGGLKSWNEGWVRGIRHLRNSGEVEHPEKYVAYIIEQRRKAGLPEIVFSEGEKAPKAEKAESSPPKKDKGDANKLFGR